MRLLSLILVATIVLADNYPGMRTSININALNNLRSKYIPKILNKLTSSPIPSESFSFLALVIPCKLTLTDIVLSEASVNTTGTVFSVSSENNQLILHISSLSMKVKANYKYNYPIFSSGTLNASFNGADISVPVELFIKDGALHSKVLSSGLQWDQIDVELQPTGSISKFFGFLFKYWPLHDFSQYIYKKLVENISTSYDSKLKEKLATIDYTQDFSSIPISTNYHIFNMTMDSSGVVLSQNGSFYLTGNPSEVSPVVSPNLLPNFLTKNTLRLQFTEYFFNSMLWSMFASNSLTMLIKSQDVPSSFPFVFTTTGLSKLVPALKTIYGPGIPVNMDCSVYKIPDVNIQTQISVFLSFYCDFVVMISPSAGTTAFRLLGRASTSFVGELQTVDEKLYLFGSFDDHKTSFDSFTVTSSNVGNFSPSGLQQAFNYQAYYITVQANKIFEDQGVEIPVPSNMTISNPDIEIYTGALEIGLEAYF